MALTRAKKTQKVEALAKELAGSTSAIVGTFAQLTVAQDFQLRQKVREAGGSYRVLKNKLAARASMGSGIEAALQGLKGVSSVAYTSGDPVALAKALTAWVKDNAQFTFKLGIVDGKVLTVEDVQSLATMPGKDEIYAKLLFLISAPAQRLVTVINAASRDLAVVIHQGVEKGKFAEGVAAASPVSVAPPVDVTSATVVADAHAEAAPALEAALVETPAAEAVVAEAGEPAAASGTTNAADAMGVPASTPTVEAAPEVAAAAASTEAVPASAVVAPEVEPDTPEAGEPAAESGATNAADAIEVPAVSAEAAAEAEVSVVADPVSEAPAPAEGPAAEGSEAESQPTQAEEAAGEAPVEG